VNKTNGTKGRIREAAGQIYDREGLSALTMRSIARQVGITPTALYRHYSSRDAILKDVWAIGYEELAGSMTAPIEAELASDRILTLLDRYLVWALKQSELYEGKHRFSPRQHDLLPKAEDGTVGEVTNEALIVLVEEVRRGIDRGEFRDEGVWIMAMAVWTLGHGMIALHRSRQLDLTEDSMRQAAQECMILLLRGYAA
jgi:AcrR family transcriptional regulator